MNAVRTAPDAAVRERRSPGGQICAIPARVAPCAGCRAPLGRGYPACAVCAEAVDRLWTLDWAALLAREGVAAGGADEALLAGVVVAEWERHPFTVVECAVERVPCAACGAHLGGGPRACAECAMAQGNLWGLPDGEPPFPGIMAGNLHALRVGRWFARHPHRVDEDKARAYGLLLPLFLTGQIPTPAQGQAIRAAILKGHAAALAACETFDAMSARAACLVRGASRG